MKTLRNCSKNVYSQFGEDGIIEEIFKVIETSSKICIEFGAWDGFHLSNTANLWNDQNWYGVLIEGERSRYRTLVENTRGRNVTCVEQWVAARGPAALDGILRSHGVPKDEIDLLSMDTDGSDYHILEGLQFRPRVVVCEYNPTIPALVDLFDPTFPNSFGASASAICRVAKTKGYRLVAVTDANCIFVRDEDFPKFSAYVTDLDKIRIDDYLHYFMLGFDGDYLLSRKPYIRAYFPYPKTLTGPHARVSLYPASLARPTALARRLKRGIANQLSERKRRQRRGEG